MPNMPNMNEEKTHKGWVGRWLRSIRIKSNLSAEAIAETLGIHPTNVRMRERGAAISADDLPTVLAAYGTTIRQYEAAASRAYQ